MFIRTSFRLEGDFEADTLIVTSCGLSKAFCDVYVLGPKPEKVAKIVGDDEEKEANFGDIFKASKGVVVLNVAFKTLQESDCNALAKLIVNLPMKNFAVLHSQHISNFRTFESREKFAIKRYLKTEAWKETFKGLAALESPNVVTGIAAGVLTAAQFASKAAILLISYSDSHYPDSMSLSGFNDLFKLSESVKRHPEAEENLKRLSKKTETLYAYS